MGKSQIDKSVKKLAALWSELCDRKFSFSDKGLSSIRGFLNKLSEDEVIKAMHIAADRFGIDEIENRFRYLCGICHSKIRQNEGDTSDEVFNKARYYYLKQKSGYFREEQLRLFSRRYSLQQIKEAIDVAFSQGRSNYWNAVCEALAEITGDDIEI